MDNNFRIGAKPAPFLQNNNNGLFLPMSAHIGIVKNNLDPTRAGRVQVYIPDYGGANENDPSTWLSVYYVSPFRGQTRRTISTSLYVDKSIDINSQYENSFQSYGMWFPVPDINVKILCIFVNGDPSQGYWLGCVGDPSESHMIPAIGAVTAQSSTNSGGYYWNPTQILAQQVLAQYIQLSGSGGTEIPYRLPVSEPTLNTSGAQPQDPTSPSKTQVVPHIQQSIYLGIQGLAFDFIRGTTSASSIRENPSQVFGVSTPGRLSPFANAALSQELLQQMNEFVNNGGQVDAQTSSAVTKALSTTYRAGGHQFVMDDGTVDGLDQGIRIRSATGHMILMDDTNSQIYIVTANGNAWIELTPSGRIDIFANNDFSVRSKGNVNLHADQNINFNANGALNMYGSSITLNAQKNFIARSGGSSTFYSSGDLQIGSDGKLKLYCSGDGSLQADGDLVINSQKTNINSGAGSRVSDPGALPQTKQIETAQQSGSKVWWQEGNYNSIVNRATAHEPWPGHEVNGIITYNVSQGTIVGNVITRPNTSGATSSGVRKTNKTNQINESQIAKQPLSGAVCGLTVTQTQALFAQIAHVESSNNYHRQNPLGYAGKYQLGADALIGQGYLKPGTHTGTNAQAINNPANWTGLNGCNSVQDFLNNPSAQESAMQGYTQKNCKALRALGIINANSDPEQIGGYLMAAHLVGPGGARTLYQIQNNESSGSPPSDANNTSSLTYYNLGSNAVSLGTSAQNA